MRQSPYSVYVRRLCFGRAFYYAKTRDIRTDAYRPGRSTQIEVHRRYCGVMLDMVRKSALANIGIKRPTQKARGLVFHGLRHWFVSQLRGTLPDHVVQALAGHKNAKVTEDYSHVVDFETARKRVEEIAKPKQKNLLDAR